MLAAAITLALFGFILTLVVDVIRRDGVKIIAALEGHSWTARPTIGRPVTIRFSRPDRAAEPARALTALRAAA